MIATAKLEGLAFDQQAFDKALKAADFERCHILIDGQDGADVRLASSLLALRERRYLDVIALLSDFPESSEAQRGARNVFLGAALGFTSDYASGLRLIDKALNDLLPGDPLYDDAHYYKSAIAWMQHENGEAEEAAQIQLRSNDANGRARAHIMLSWVAVRRRDLPLQVDELLKALDEIDATDSPDEYLRANALYTLALLCRELPMHDTAERVRHVYETLPWTSGLRVEHFQVTRFLAGIDELEGNDLGAFGSLKKASKLAPSDHWNVSCYLDRAMLASVTGEKAFAAEQLQEAHDLAQRISWSDVKGEECSALLALAELFAERNPAISEQYLARFRALKSSIGPAYSYGTDRRVRGHQAYSQGMAWLRLGDIGEGTASLNEAWEIFEEFDYGWRAALCAIALFEATGDRRWIERAAVKVAPWPNSWIARRVSEAKAPAVVAIDRVPQAKRDMLELVKDGNRNADIAKKLGRSQNTVRNQMSQLFDIFDVKSRAELAEVVSKPVVSITRLRDHQRNRG